MMTAIPSPEPLALLDDLVLFEHGDPGSRPAGMSTNSYALLADGEALLVDATWDYLMPSIRALATRGHEPAGIVLTHRHLLAGNEGMLEEFEAEFGALSVFLHPLDAGYSPDADDHAVGHPLENVEPGTAGVEFRDPVGSPLLARFGVEAVPFPGHTEGSVLLYRSGGGGLVLSGDAAMGTTARQDAEGLERLVRGPASFNVDDARLRQNWIEFDRPVTHFAPYHGRTAYLHRGAGEMEEIMRPLRREEPTLGMEG